MSVGQQILRLKNLLRHVVTGIHSLVYFHQSPVGVAIVIHDQHIGAPALTVDPTQIMVGEPFDEALVPIIKISTDDEEIISTY